MLAQGARRLAQSILTEMRAEQVHLGRLLAPLVAVAASAEPLGQHFLAALAALELAGKVICPAATAAPLLLPLLAVGKLLAVAAPDLAAAVAVMRRTAQLPAPMQQRVVEARGVAGAMQPLRRGLPAQLVAVAVVRGRMQLTQTRRLLA